MKGDQEYYVDGISFFVLIIQVILNGAVYSALAFNGGRKWVIGIAFIISFSISISFWFRQLKKVAP